MAGMFDPTPDTGSDSPFNSNEPGDMGEGFDIAPIPVGILRGSVVEAKKTKSGDIVVSVQCNDPNYASTDEVAIFVGNDTQLLGQLAGALGVTVTQQGGKLFLQDDAGNTGLKALTAKTGLFVFAPYSKDGIEQASINKFGLPKPKSSELWDSYMEQSNFSEAQITAIKRARGGVVPADKHHLFTE